MKEWMNKWRNEWKKEGTDEWMNEWINKWMNWWRDRSAMRSYLLNVVVQNIDPQSGGEAGVGEHCGTHWCWLDDEALVRGLQEEWWLVVLIQNLDVEVSKCRQGVAVVLLCLENRIRKYVFLLDTFRWHLPDSLLLNEHDWEILNKCMYAALRVSKLFIYSTSNAGFMD